MSSNIEVKLDVLNQKGSPALFASSLATRPAASFTGRLFVDSDSPSTGIYRDTGSVWVQVADQGAGTTGTLQQVTTNGSTTNVGITITAGGLTSNLITVQENGLSSKTNYIGQTMAINDSWKIYGTGTTTDQGEMVFEVGDNGTAYATGGERFRFSYDASSSGTAKDVLVVDYTSSYFNTNLGINTITPGSPLDIHTATGINATFNGTGTTNSALQLQSAGVGKWNLSNFYNAGANDFIVRDFTNSLNRITVKNTGQTFIGADTTSSGLFVVNSATADSQIVVIGANSPSFRIRNTGTSPTLNVGLGISTGVNNFIQSSASGDFCIFNGNTTASPITFGIYDAGASNIQEAARISAAQNLLVGGTSDNGSKLQITGDIKTTGAVVCGGNITVNNTVAAGTTNANLTLNGNGTGGINFGYGAGTGNYTFFNGTTQKAKLFNTGDLEIGYVDPSNSAMILHWNGSSSYGSVQTYSSSSLALNPAGNNVLIGTTTDNGFKLQVNGNIFSNGNILISKLTPFVNIRGTSFGNSGAGLTLEGWATTYKNWQISVGTSFTSGLELLSSTVAGGNTFTTAVGRFDETTGIYTALSDINKKKNLEFSYYGLNEILKLKPTLYNIKNEENCDKHLGFIAQEVKEVIKEAYVESGDFIGLDYQAITATIVKAIQELNDKVNKLKN